MEHNSKDKILNKIRRGIYSSNYDTRGDSGSVYHRKEDCDSPNPGIQTIERRPSKGGDLIEDFINEQGKVNGLAKIIKRDDEIKDYLTNLAAENSAKSCLVWETALIKRLKVIEYLKGNGLKLIRSQNRKTAAKADIGITEADYAIADSGTLVLFTDPKKPRLASLIAPIHVAILDSRNIMEDMFVLFQRVKYKYLNPITKKDPMSCLTLITGPSRTADIELNLTLGVHGPKELHTLIYNK